MTPVSSCEDAFALLEKDAEFDLVLMDLILDEHRMSGSEGIRKLRKEYPALPVVALSIKKDSKTIRATIKDGAFGYIPKTHPDDLFVWAVELVLVHKRVYLPPEVLSGGDDELPDDVLAPAVSQFVTTPESIGLTQRQGDVLLQLLQGRSNKEIASALHIKETVVRAHVNAVLRVLNVTSRLQAVIEAYRRKLVFGEGPGARIKYTCPNCRVAAWSKGGIKLMCGACNQTMSGDDSGDGAGKR